MYSALLVVAKKPAPGLTKTRLCPPLDGKQAADLYECFLRDTLAIMRRVSGVRLGVVYLPKDAGAYFQKLAPDMACFQQRGESLGERLDNLLTDVLSSGAGKAVVINSDSPNLPEVYLSQAFEKLNVADVVLGPTIDGGYYLVGMKEPHPQLLREVQMSTSSVLEDTLKLATSSGLKVSLLPEWYDIDKVEDLQRLRVDITGVVNGSCEYTQAWLARYPSATPG